jgi:predicted esterase
MSCRWPVAACLVGLLLAGPEIRAQEPKEVRVAAPTRLDWQFAVRGFGADAARLPPGFDSTRQRYQLFVPPAYQPGRTWPLVLFISPSAQPAGWAAWQKVCVKESMFFCSPLTAGNSVPAGQRTRIILDVLDDVRRHYRIDPDQTYLGGFSGGGRMACAIGFALPECFGGVIAMCGTNPVQPPTYLRHRLEEHLAVAFVTGATDVNRKETEVYMQPYFQELGIHSKLWVVPKMGHAIPPAAVVDEVQAWLAADLKRRWADGKARPGLVLAPDEAPTAAEQARRLVETAEAELKQPERVWRGVALLQGASQRWGQTEAGRKAGRLLQGIAGDEKLLEIIAVQGARDEQQSLAAQARGLERFGQLGKAIAAWEILAKNYADQPVGQQAREEIRRLKAR